MNQSELDQLFGKILSEMILTTIKSTAESTSNILKLSESYLEHKTHKALEDFHNLYFSDKLAAEKQAINDEVDSFIDQALSQGESSQEITATLTEEFEERRLALCAIQKELEGLITLDGDMKAQLAPILTSMQFEDATRQRLEHIQEGWQQIIDNGCHDDRIDFESIKQLTSSVEETASFYRDVLDEEPPDDTNEEPSSILFF